MIWLLGGVLLLLLAQLALRGLTQTDPAALARLLKSLGKWAFAAGILALAIWLAASGRLSLLWVTGVALLPWIHRLRTVHRVWRFLRRRGVPDPNAPHRAAPPRSGPMTVEEARSALGVDPEASEAEIRAAHRRLIKSVHPDHGGSAWLAARINEARDALLQR